MRFRHRSGAISRAFKSKTNLNASNKSTERRTEDIHRTGWLYALCCDSSPTFYCKMVFYIFCWQNLKLCEFYGIAISSSDFEEFAMCVCVCVGSLNRYRVSTLLRRYNWTKDGASSSPYYYQSTLRWMADEFRRNKNKILIILKSFGEYFSSDVKMATAILSVIILWW